MSQKGKRENWEEIIGEEIIAELFPNLTKISTYRSRKLSEPQVG